MRKILYYKHDGRKKDKFSPVYFEAPWYLWLIESIFGGFSRLFLHIQLWAHHKIEHKKRK